MLVQYVRNKHGNRIGVVVAILDNDSVKMGWSKCNMKLDKFDKNLGLTIAIGRAKKMTTYETKRIPRSIHITAKELQKRAASYFKQTRIVFNLIQEV